VLDPIPPAKPGPATHTPVCPGGTGSVDDSNRIPDGISDRTIASAPTISARRYELGDEIARGGMGVIYRATDTAFAREVAVKVLTDKFGAESGASRRFSDEARITGQLQHPAIPPIHDLGIFPDGRQFLVMKLIKGNTLEELLKVRSDPSIERGRFVAVFEQVCQALAYAHAHDVIHRDLKPANVMVGSFGEVQVMDWGLAKVLGLRVTEQTDPAETCSNTAIQSLRDSDSSVTQAGSVLGTPAYMPPEQAIGAITRIDARSDVFGLGAILAVILTGKPPFAASSVETTRLQAAQGNVEECHARLDASGAEPDLVSLCKRCLSKKPGDRPADAGEVARAVAALRAAANERARQAELDRVKAEGDKVAAELQAVEQRKRRHVQLALAGLVLFVLVGGGITVVQVQRQREKDRIATERATRATSLVDSLGGADTPSVPRIIEDLANLRDLARPKLNEMRASAKPRQQLHASLALLPEDAAQVDYLYHRLLDAQPHEVPVVRDALAPHKDALLDKLWAVVEKPEKGKESQRLRAAAALAKYDPASEKWKPCGLLVVSDLVQENPVYLGLWSEMYRSVKNSLLDPLTAVFQDHRPERAAERSLATNLLADYAADAPVKLADLLMEADKRQFAVIYPKLKDQGDKGLPLLLGEIDRSLPAELPSSDDKRETMAKRQANAAVALLRLNQPEKVWPLLKHSPDPRVRSYLIHRFGPLGVDFLSVVNRLDQESDITIRRALILSLGEYGERELSSDVRNSLLSKLQAIYRTAADPGLHAATEWLLRTWKQETWLKQVNEEWALASRERKRPEFPAKAPVAYAPGSPRWFVNTQGQTMTVIPGPVEFLMGSPLTEKDRGEREVPHRRRISRSFAIASKSVTLTEYRSLTKDKYILDEKYIRYPDLPVVAINWYTAAKYCNLLSKEEGIPQEQWCYETDASGEVTKLKENYLGLTGYRLPTEAEMEYATRAGAGTSRYYGETDELLGNYAWYAKNAGDLLQRVGQKKPNDFGLFDAQGNCFTWCQDPAGDYPKTEGEEAVEDKEVDKSKLIVGSNYGFMLRGGSFILLSSGTRSSYRLSNLMTNRVVNMGFRVARTIVP